MSSYPRILLEGHRYRLVCDEKPDNSGVLEKVFVIEFMDGMDAMGQPRWVDANKRDSNTVYQGGVNWLKNEMGKLLIKE
jgi:hypothetical protein